MIFNRKYFNADAVEATAASTEVTEQPSLASLMATQGFKSDGNHGETQITNTEQTEKPTETETTGNAAIATTETKVEEKTETPTQTEVQETVVTPTIEAAKEPAPSWQEVAQKQPNEVLKALGYEQQVTDFLGELKEVDPKVVGILKAYKDGNLTEYVTELTTDYSKLSAEEVMRHQLRKDYPKASERHLDVLFNREVVAAYNLDSDDDDLKEEGRLLLEAKADRYRDSLIENQEKFLIPKYEPNKAVDNSNNELQQQQAEADRKFNEMYRAEVENNALTKNIIANKVLPIGEGDNKFNFPVEPSKVMDVLYNNNGTFTEAMWEKTVDSNGNQSMKPKTEHQLLVAAVATYGMGFVNKLIEHGISLGSKSVIAPIDNAKAPEGTQTSAAAAAPTSLAAAMAKQGRYIPGGN